MEECVKKPFYFWRTYWDYWGGTKTQFWWLHSFYKGEEGYFKEGQQT